MTARDKARELVHKMYVGFVHDLHSYKAKQCALICVDEILNAVTTIADKKYDYWKEVKEQILNNF